MSDETGWGSMGWGSGPWGGGEGAGVLALTGVLAWRENVLRLFFTERLYITGLGDARDALNVRRYAVAPVAGSVGMNGDPAWPVAVAEVLEAIDVDPALRGKVVDLVTDRPMTPHPSRYVVQAQGLWSVDGFLQLDASAASAAVVGVHKVLSEVTDDPIATVRDVANPQLRADGLGDPANPANLGTVPIASDGDYASDSGVASYKKRILRRLVTRRDAFVHLPGYGVGIPSYGKKLSLAATRAQLAADAEAQIALEPETAAVTVRLVTDPTNPALTRCLVRAKMKSGAQVNLDQSFRT